MSVYVQYIVGYVGSFVGQREVKERYRRGREPGALGSMGRGPAALPEPGEPVPEAA